MHAVQLKDHRPCPRGPGKLFHGKKLGEIDLDLVKLAVDLDAIGKMARNDAYGLYNLTVDPRLAGEWSQIILGNWSGDATDGHSKEYDGHFQWTQEGTKVAYIRELVESTFRCNGLKSVRIFRAKNALIAAHRDYMEFKKGFRRLHIPLRTNDSCMNSEGDAVYRMKIGNIYFLDGREAHSGGNLGREIDRDHLVLDFDPDIPAADLFYFPEQNMAGGEIEFIERATLNYVDLDKLIEGLATIITPLNYGMIVGLANTLTFSHNFDTATVYDVVVDAATKSGNSEVIERSRADRKFFLGTE